jgi:DNA-binding NarL/FixJ family response regulator
MRRLLVLTDERRVVEDVRLGVQRVAGLDLVGVATPYLPAHAALGRFAPDVVLIDADSARDLTLSRIREVAAAAPAAKCVVLAAAMHESSLRPKFDAGADAAIARGLDGATLGRLLADVAEERVLQRPRWDAYHTADGARDPLTHRELEILRLVALGKTNAGIARALTVGEQTVKFHLSNIYRKLGVGNRTEASHYAYAHDLMDDRPRMDDPPRALESSGA